MLFMSLKMNITLESTKERNQDMREMKVENIKESWEQRTPTDYFEQISLYLEKVGMLCKFS